MLEPRRAALASALTAGLHALPFVRRRQTGSSLWLTHMKMSMLCGSLVLFVVDTGLADWGATFGKNVNSTGDPKYLPAAMGDAYSPLTRLLTTNVTHATVHVHWDQWACRRAGFMAHTSCTAPARHGLCDHLAANVQMWLQDDTRAREIGLRGRRLVAEQFNLASVYRHMDAMVRRLGELQSDRAVSKMITALRGVPITQRNYEDVMLRPGALPENGRRTSVDELVGTLRLHRKLLFADGGGPHGVVEAEDRAAPTVNDVR
jgi:hypothetical protein